jgi:uncharacterized SAM-binding protein YcdF (DUF218 family)
MLFWLKKTISYWLMPVPISLVLIGVGLLLMRSARRARLGRALVLAAAALLAIVSNKFVAHSLLRPLETRYPAIPELAAGTPLPADLAACRYVVILGGGNHRTPGVAASNLLSGAALSRLTEGVRIARLLPAAKLIVTGPGTPSAPAEPTHAAMLARAAVGLGIAPDRILYIEAARDTEDESRAAKQIAGDAPVALVTSAWHMPRAAALFRSAGLPTVPCPADFATKANPDWNIEDFLWEVGAINGTSLALRERLGYLWVWLRGKI